MSNTINASQLMMQQMRQMETQSKSNPVLEQNPFALGTTSNTASDDSQRVSFTDLLGGAISHVNSYQKASGQLKKDFEMGKEGVDLVEVMLASEKASVAFSALLETRNKLLQAYQKIERIRV